MLLSRKAQEAERRREELIRQTLSELEALRNTTNELFDAWEKNRHFMLVGRIAMRWTGLEVNLDFWCLYIQDCAGGSVLQKNLPSSLRGKVQYFRKAYATLPPLIPFAAEATPLIDEIEALKTKRHDLIHGFVVDSNETETAKTYTRHIFEGTRIRRHIVPYSNADLEELELAVVDLKGRVYEHIRSIARVLDPDDPNNADR